MQSSEESDSAAFVVRFEVLFGNVLRELELPSDTAYSDFLADVAVAVGMRVSSLCIGYIFSFWPKSPKPRPKVLDGDKTWQTLLRDARLWLKGKSGLKRKGKQSAKPWHVQIEDLTTENAGTGELKGKVSYMYMFCIVLISSDSFRDQNNR